jgi:hypothetical protein
MGGGCERLVDAEHFFTKKTRLDERRDRARVEKGCNAVREGVSATGTMRCHHVTG